MLCIEIYKFALKFIDIASIKGKFKVCNCFKCPRHICYFESVYLMQLHTIWLSNIEREDGKKEVS
jgi:hypothetical protein